MVSSRNPEAELVDGRLQRKKHYIHLSKDLHARNKLDTFSASPKCGHLGPIRKMTRYVDKDNPRVAAQNAQIHERKMSGRALLTSGIKEPPPIYLKIVICTSLFYTAFRQWHQPKSRHHFFWSRMNSTLSTSSLFDVDTITIHPPPSFPNLTTTITRHTQMIKISRPLHILRLRVCLLCCRSSSARNLTTPLNTRRPRTQRHECISRSHVILLLSRLNEWVDISLAPA